MFERFRAAAAADDDNSEDDALIYASIKGLLVRNVPAMSATNICAIFILALVCG